MNFSPLQRSMQSMTFQRPLMNSGDSQSAAMACGSSDSMIPALAFAGRSMTGGKLKLALMGMVAALLTATGCQKTPEQKERAAFNIIYKSDTPVGGSSRDFENPIVRDILGRTRDCLETSLKVELDWDVSPMHPTRADGYTADLDYKLAARKVVAQCTLDEVSAKGPEIKKEIDAEYRTHFTDRYLVPLLRMRSSELMATYTLEQILDNPKMVKADYIKGYEDPSTGKTIPSLAEALNAVGISMNSVKINVMSVQNPKGGRIEFELYGK